MARTATIRTSTARASRQAVRPARHGIRETQQHIPPPPRPGPHTVAELLQPYEPPPGVLPQGATAKSIAMDAAGVPVVYSPNLITWANSGLFHAGLGFFGYPYLAELSQLPEYQRISYLWAEHTTRKFVKLKGPEAAVKTIDAAMVRFDVAGKFREAALQDGLMGRSQIFIDLGQTDGDELATELRITKDKISKNKLVGLKVVEPMWSYPGRYNSSNPLGQDFYKPDQWYVMGRSVHASRLMQFIGTEVPDILKPSYAFGGMSRTQMVKAYVDNWLGTRESVANLLQAFSIIALGTDMAQLLTGDCDNADLIRRIEMFNAFRSNRGTFVYNKDSEEITNLAVPLSSVPELQNQSIEFIAAIAGLPLVIYLGTTPSGLNADAEDEIRTFYTNVKAYQEQVFRSPLQRIIEVLQLNEGMAVDPDITFEFIDLWEIDETARATVDKSKADAHAVYVDIGAVTNDEVRKSLEADETGLYSRIDLSGEAPDPPDPTGEFGEMDDPPPEGGDAALAIDGEWNESDHPRAASGEFGSGGGSSTSHREKHDPGVSGQVAKMRETGWKGVSKKPKTFGAAAATAAMRAHKEKRDWYVIPTGLGVQYGPHSEEMENSYKLGIGMRITPEGEVFRYDRPGK